MTVQEIHKTLELVLNEIRDAVEAPDVETVLGRISFKNSNPGKKDNVRTYVANIRIGGHMAEYSHTDIVLAIWGAAGRAMTKAFEEVYRA